MKRKTILCVLLMLTICVLLTSCSTPGKVGKMIDNLSDSPSLSSLVEIQSEYDSLSANQKEKVSNYILFEEKKADYIENALLSAKNCVIGLNQKTDIWYSNCVTGYCYSIFCTDEPESVSLSLLSEATGIDEDSLLKQLSLYVNNGTTASDPYVYSNATFIMMAYPQAYYAITHNYELILYSGTVMEDITSLKKTTASIRALDSEEPHLTVLDELAKTFSEYYNYLYDIDSSGLSLDLGENEGEKGTNLRNTINSLFGEL